MIHRLPLIALLVSFAGCSATPAVTTAPSKPTTVVSTGDGSVVQFEDDMELESPLRHSAERVWALIPAIFQELNLGGQVMDEKRRLYGNDKVSVTKVAGQNPQTFFRCANEATGMGGTMRYRMQFSIRTAVTVAAGGSSKLNTAITGTASPIDGSSAAKLDCVSNGKLEREIRRAVIAKLGK